MLNLNGKAINPRFIGAMENVPAGNIINGNFGGTITIIPHRAGVKVTLLNGENIIVEDKNILDISAMINELIYH